MTNTLKRLLVAVPATIFAFGCGVANAGKTIEEAGVIVCVNDKWDEKELEKGHKLVDYAGRCVKVPDDSAAAKTTEACEGKYEYLPDGSWKAKGTCTASQNKDDTITATWEEGSHLTANPYKATGGTGKFKGIGGGGTYKYDQLSDTLFGGRYSSKWELP
jgi:hypothetical protein